MKNLSTRYLQAILSVFAPQASQQDDPERGDVPGWVMITMKTNPHLNPSQHI